MVGASDTAPPDTGGGGGQQWLMRCGGQRRRRRSGAGTVEERARRCGRTGRTRVVFSEDRAVDAPYITRDYRASSDVLLSNFIVIEMEVTVFTPSLEGIKHVKSDSGEILTKPFLEVCKHILPVLEKFGSAMSIVKSDIGGNITRLEAKYASDPSKFEQLHSMVKIEVSTKTTNSSSSCTNGLLWLTRAMDFLVALFHNLVKHPDWQMSQACSDAYGKTLKKWHGWLASSSFSVAIKLAPDRKKFMEIISGSGDINADIEKFCATFSPLLAENHKFLASVGMDDLKAS